MTVKILIQPQEQRNHHFGEWFAYLGYEWEESEIVGDIAVPELGIGIERKTTDDFVSSVFDGRLLSQAAEMARVYERPWVVLDDDPSTLNDVKPNVYWGATNSIEEHYGCRFAITFGNFPEWLHYKIKKITTPGKAIDFVRGPRQVVSKEQRVQHILMSCPGIGPAKAALAKDMKLIPALRFLKCRMAKDFQEQIDDGV